MLKNSKVVLSLSPYVCLFSLRSQHCISYCPHVRTNFAEGFRTTHNAHHIFHGLFSIIIRLHLLASLCVIQRYQTCAYRTCAVLLQTTVLVSMSGSAPVFDVGASLHLSMLQCVTRGVYTLASRYADPPKTNIYAIQQDTQCGLMSKFYSALMLALHVSDLMGPSSGAFCTSCIRRLWYVL